MSEPTKVGGYTIIGPLCYQGKVGCTSVICTRVSLGRTEDGGFIWEDACRGWHCTYCDEPCSSQGHRCDAAEAILGEARRIAAGRGEDVAP